MRDGDDASLNLLTSIMISKINVLVALVVDGVVCHGDGAHVVTEQRDRRKLAKAQGQKHLVKPLGFAGGLSGSDILGMI